MLHYYRMTYVALLRGINVGGKNRVEMARLRSCLIDLGYQDVSTYINSGNVIFRAPKQNPEKLAVQIEQALAKEFELTVPVLIRNRSQMQGIVDAITKAWDNLDSSRVDVLFLWRAYDRPTIVDDIKSNPEIEDTLYVAGALVWRVDHSAVTRSGLQKIVGTDLYREITIRNLNTTRKLAALVKQASSKTS